MPKKFLSKLFALTLSLAMLFAPSSAYAAAGGESNAPNAKLSSVTVYPDGDFKLEALESDRERLQNYKASVYNESVTIACIPLSADAEINWSVNGEGRRPPDRIIRESDETISLISLPLKFGMNAVTVRSRLGSAEEVYSVNISRLSGKDFRLKSAVFPDGSIIRSGRFSAGNFYVSGFAKEGVKKYDAVFMSENPEATLTLLLEENTIAENVGVLTAKDLPVGEKTVLKIWDGTYEKDFLEYNISISRNNPLTPDSVYAVMPAPGQFVNEPGWGTNWNGMLTEAGGGMSLGAFGGYVVYRFDEPVKNSPNNEYGVDLVIGGNAFSGWNEPGGVMVAKENGRGAPAEWYGLAGSEHYEDSTYWDYSVKYTNPRPDFTPYSNVSVPWADNRGNSGFVIRNGYHAQPYYPGPLIYVFNDNAANGQYSAESMTYTGVKIDATQVGFGYVDATIGRSGDPFVSGNPYIGDYGKFDIGWAVDEEGMPVYLDEISFVKIYTGVLIDAGMFGEVSTEVCGIQRADKKGGEPVGKTPAPEKIIISAEGFEPIEILPDGGKDVYDVDVGTMRFIKAAAEAAEGDVIYINNKAVESGEFLQTTYEVTRDAPRLFRVLTQRGNMEPNIVILRVSSHAEHTESALSGIEVRQAENAKLTLSRDTAGKYGATAYPVGNLEDYKYVRVIPNAPDGVKVTVNGYALQKGGRSVQFDITAEHVTRIVVSATARGKPAEEAVVEITNKYVAPEGEIAVTLRLFGAPLNDGSLPEPWTYKNNVKDQGGSRYEWIKEDTYLVPAGATVKDVFEAALSKAGLKYVSGFGGNYISSVTSPDGVEFAEFTNGPNSGWMYLVNGEYAETGLAEYVLEDGDSIVWHYTDDYQLEKSGILSDE